MSENSISNAFLIHAKSGVTVSSLCDALSEIYRFAEKLFRTPRTHIQ